MLISQLITVADAVTDAINAAEILPAGVVAERSYPEWDETLEEIGELRCDVVPVVGEGVELLSRDRTKNRCTVDIGIRKRFAQSDFNPDTGRISNEKIDPLVTLLESIVLLVTGKRLASIPSIAWINSTIPTTYSRRHLRENKQYLGIGRIEFAIHREVT